MDSALTCKEEDALLNAFRFSHSPIFSRVLDAAMRLDLFGIIEKLAHGGAYVSANSIASKLGAQNPTMLHRILRLFAAHGLLIYSEKTLSDGRVETVYRLTPTSELFIKEEGGLLPLFKLRNKIMDMGVWVHLEDAILEGGGDLFTRVLGMPMYEYMNKDQEFNNIFNEAMASATVLNTKAILNAYKGFNGIESLVDVGGGTGETLNMIISKYPSIKGINYDLPHVVQTAPQYPGIQHVGGSMLDSIPNGEVIMIKNACHNWSDEKALLILRNIYEALPIGGKLIVIDEIKLEQPNTTMISQLGSTDDVMMLALYGAKERTTLESKALIQASGFTKVDVACVASGIWGIMEAFK